MVVKKKRGFDYFSGKFIKIRVAYGNYFYSDNGLYLKEDDNFIFVRTKTVVKAFNRRFIVEIAVEENQKELK